MMAVKKTVKPKPKVIAPVNTGATLIQNYAGYGATPITTPVDDLAPYRQSLVQNYAGYGVSNYGGLAGTGQAGGGGAVVTDNAAEAAAKAAAEKAAAAKA
jgi:hypothetical protein